MNFNQLTDKLFKNNYIVDNDENKLSIYSGQFPMFRFFIENENDPFIYIAIGAKNFMYNVSSVPTDLNIFFVYFI